MMIPEESTTRFDLILTYPIVVIRSMDEERTNAALLTWIDHLHLPYTSAWFNLEPEDNAPDRFLEDLRKVLRLSDTKAECPQDRVTTRIEFENELVEILNCLTMMPGILLLVIEAYTALNDRMILDGIEWAMDYLPEQLHLVIITQTEICLDLAYLRVRRKMAEISYPDDR